MEINWLRDFVSLEATRSFSKAAQNRNASVSALSRRIQMLESWAGEKLVDRTSHPVSLTPAGTALLPVAQAVIRELDLVKSRLRGGSTGIRFLMPNSVSVSVFPRLLVLLQSSLGALPVSVMPENFREVMSRFQAAEADFALYYEAAESFTSRPFPARRGSIVIARDALLPVAKEAKAAARGRGGGLRTIILNETSYLGQVARATMLHHRLSYTVSVTGTQILSIRQFALDGAGMAWLPLSLVSDDLSAGRLVRLLPDMPPVRLNIHAIRHPTAISDYHAAVWERLKALSSSTKDFMDFTRLFAKNANR